MERVEVLIYGAGAIGSILGWRLAQHETTRVSVLCRSNHDDVKQNGIFIQSILWGDGHFIPDEVLRAGAALPNRDFDYIILANKIKTEEDVAVMIRDLKSLVRDSTTIVSAQNGMDNEVPLREAFPENTILSSICNLVCTQTQPGLVEQVATIKTHAFHLGVYDHREVAVSAHLLRRDRLASMDPHFVVIHNVHEERWQKLIFNSSWNSMTALAGLDTHELFCHPMLVHIVRQLAIEARSVGVASGVKLPVTLPDKIIEIAKGSGPIVTSTLSDARNGRMLEVKPITGYLVNQAARLGISIPWMSAVYDRLRQINRPLADESHEPQCAAE
ncbi:hypothetical protein M409DRAFT_63704 [Zasmidium cellare ATCC 36951]|uniref:2-dehydropantoate 2-reductase n=1 Tax=Zasmidium cellare ATCC 36951 TaxID=1080233 RepID=A0A6A6D023_ZASCE|nr:uncharacterized protein M409DRAFT_63704 [Zasmidium cellare ATCC 36951]KAF2171429.1 hypothetical protein M409DRAFT_63704 [Zasmidium cellare ATCC 36951]